MTSGVQPILAVAIFAGVYAVIVSERIHRTVAVLVGASLVLLLRIVKQNAAFAAVDWNTVFLLLGMMVIVGMTKRTGLFQWLAMKSAKAARAEPVRMIVMLSVVTAVLSAFLDNVTTVLLIAPVTILIAETLAISPVPFLISEVLASNIGGTATLIGDPPNIMIGSAAELGFVSFVVHLAPVVVIIALVYLATVARLFGRVTLPAPVRARILQFDESKAITDRALLRRCLVVLGLTLAGFCVHERLGLMPATIALAGAALLLLIDQPDLEQVLHEIEWPTLLFFIGLFVMVSALVETGVIRAAARPLFALARRSLPLTAAAVLWGSGLLSGVIGSVPLVAAVNPILLELAHRLAPAGADFHAAVHGAQMMPLWWSLALGACLGGNATLVASMANVVVAGLAERSGYPIRFVDYLKYGIPVVIESLVISSAYIYLRYLR